jgi:glycosyltransferase involved in cell wall biosynthesis
MMGIKILAVFYSKELSGGANRSTLSLLEYLIKMYGHEVYAVTPGVGAVNERLDAIGIRWESRPYAIAVTRKLRDGKDFLRVARIKARLLRGWFLAMCMAKKLRARRFDVVYTNESLVLLGHLIARRLRVCSVWHFRSFLEGCVYAADTCFARPDSRLIPICGDMYRYLCDVRRFPERNMVLIRNGLPEEHATPSRQTRENGLHCVACGRITAEKGQMEAVRALSILVKEKRRDDIVLHIAGSRPAYDKSDYYDRVAAYVKKAGLENNVIFHGEVGDMPSFREKMNVEILCSVREPFSRAVMEGMRSGLIVVGSDTGGTPDAVTDGVNGFLYHQGSPEHLAEILERVYLDPEGAARVAKRALQDAAILFSMEENARRVNEVFCSCVNRQ